MVTESGTVQLKLSEEFSIKQNLIHLFLPKSILVVFLGKFFYIKWRFFYRFYSISILWNLQLSGQPDLSGQSAIPR